MLEKERDQDKRQKVEKENEKAMQKVQSEGNQHDEEANAKVKEASEAWKSQRAAARCTMKKIAQWHEQKRHQ